MKHQLTFAVKIFALAGGYFFTRSRTQTIKYREREKSVNQAAVLFVLVNLKRLLVYHTNLILDVKNQIEMLENDVVMFTAFLRDLAKRRHKNEALKELERQIRDLVYDGEDIIDVFLIHTTQDRPRSFFEKCVGGPMKIVSLAKEVRSIRVRVKNAFEKSRIVFATLKAGGVAEEAKTKDNKISFISLERDQDTLIRNATQELGVVSVTDMSRFGNTTQMENSFATMQEPDTDLPLAIGYVFFKNPIFGSRNSELAPLAY